MICAIAQKYFQLLTFCKERNQLLHESYVWSFSRDSYSLISCTDRNAQIDRPFARQVYEIFSKELKQAALLYFQRVF